MKRKMKRKRITTSADVNEGDNVDLISGLPDDILVYLLSFLEMKTAARTSLLSKRWSYIWTYLVHLDFDDPGFHLIEGNPTCDQIDKYHQWVHKARPIPSRFPPFPNVKQLDIEVADPADGGDSLLDFISFIQACPMLHTFKLKLNPCTQRVVSMSSLKDAQINVMRGHKHFKVMEFVGYKGSASVAVLVLFLTEHASMLEKIIFDPHRPKLQLLGSGHKLPENIDEITLWRRKAELLAERIQGGIDVVIR
ncbi:F-box/FBD/LRR-repeat protein At3g52680 isoform X2 [Spinacia oleracea]|uniref:F-box/FBD/LRR-repeat protein At3g52680 isoform X2 n=1 Tax=Spinacia oleracea TaxID=3562 RepID=A0ABM3R0H0_SPIOL|nr:F-box/FBD/LRR-repeat protein At3g52680-like isoform X2 [Spinacia oleracea]